MPRLSLRYYALLREQAGCQQETLAEAPDEAGALYEALARRHGFSLARSQLRVAVNGEFADWSRRLEDGDEVVFLPPVAGG